MKTNIYVLRILFLLLVYLVISSLTNKILYPKGFVYIPSGTYHPQSIIFSNEKQEPAISINALWMSETEVTNEDYQVFLKDLLDSGKIELYQKAYPDTARIKSRFWIGRYNINYFTHPYFKECPVVCITPEQVNLYCKWLTNRYLKIYPNIHPSGFRLPSIQEWEYAARGGRSGQYFPWGGPYLRNSKGCLLANFMYIDDKLMLFDTIAASTYRSIPWVNYYWNWSDKAIEETGNLKLLYMVKKRKYTFYGMPLWADSYFPNDFGLFNMSGNVAEMVVIDERIIRCAGGSYNTPGAYLRLDMLLDHHEKDSFPLEDVGFRLVANYKR